jgi:hypothetical protein
MSMLLQSETRGRPPRLKLAQITPAVLRFPSGDRVQGRLQVVSVTGGLLWLSSPLDQGARAKLMFLIEQAGAVLGTAEMLNPISSTQQPFRFVEIGKDDRSRLNRAIRSSTDKNWQDHQAIVRDRAW